MVASETVLAGRGRVCCNLVPAARPTHARSHARPRARTCHRLQRVLGPGSAAGGVLARWVLGGSSPPGRSATAGQSPRQRRPGRPATRGVVLLGPGCPGRTGGRRPTRHHRRPACVAQESGAVRPQRTHGCRSREGQSADCTRQSWGCCVRVTRMAKGWAVFPGPPKGPPARPSPCILCAGQLTEQDGGANVWAGGWMDVRNAPGMSARRGHACACVSRHTSN